MLDLPCGFKPYNGRLRRGPAFVTPVGITVHGLKSVGRDLTGFRCLLAFDPLALSFGLQAERHPVLFGHHRAVTRPYNGRLRRGPALAQECLGQHGKPKDRATKGAGKPKNR